MPNQLLEKQLAHLLIQQKKTLAIAESCTGGLVSHRLTNIPGSSRFLKLSVIAYHNDAKIQVLKVSPLTIKTFGAVSSQAAIEMARGIRRLAQSDIAISLTGIAGPGGATAQKKVGLTFIALASAKETLVTENHFKGTRLNTKKQSADEALKIIFEFLIGWKGSG